LSKRRTIFQDNRSFVLAEPKKESTDLIKLNGTIIKNDGKEYKTNFFEFLELIPDDYSDIEFTREEANKIKSHLTHLSTGASAAIPLTCGGGAKCPFAPQCLFVKMKKTPIGRACHPPGTLIQTVNQGQVPIEELKVGEDKVAVFHSKSSYISSYEHSSRGGAHFQLGSRDYKGQMVRIKTLYGHYDCTVDHICMARWNKNAFNKFAVYLMRRGDSWRIGKTVLFKETKSKRYSGITSRAQREQADDIWILGLYNTNTEAMLAEEELSLRFRTTKTCFIAVSDGTKKVKWNGLYKWVTQEQLDEHHRRNSPGSQFITQKLKEIGLSIDYPIWSRKSDFNSMLGSMSRLLKIRACNLISGCMDVATIDGPEMKRRKHGEKVPNKEPIEIERYDYDGIVYSLEVDNHHTYLANGIVTHNCLIEVNLLNEYTRLYIHDYHIDESSFTEIQMVRELAEIELMLWRLNNNLSKPKHAELVQESIVGVDKDGTILTKMETNAFFDTKERLNNRKTKLVKLMVGDRQEKYKREAALKQRGNDDPSNSAAELRNKIMLLTRQAEVELKKLRHAESDIIDAEVVQPLTPDDLIDGKEE